jgi:hypothetical protein
LIVILVYAAISVWSLPWYPAVHSDEVWLASLTRAMIVERDLAATEDFFAITPRHPHAIKTLYHVVQMPFLAVSFSHIGARLPSALAMIGAVWLLYSLLRRLTGNVTVAALVALAFGLDPQMLYIGHLARQEALVVAATVAAVRVAASGTLRAPLWAGLIVGLTIFIHPNAFIAAAAVVPWILVPPRHFAVRGETFVAAGAEGRAGLAGIAGRIGLFITPITAFAIAAVGLSILIDPGFIGHYSSFGAAVGVGDSGWQRLFRLRSFLGKVITRNQGTYYLPPVTPQLVWGAISVSVAPVLSFLRDRHRTDGPFALAPVLPLLSVLGVATALFLIGKYSPPSAVFFFPFLYLGTGIAAGVLLDSGIRGSAGRGIGARGIARYGGYLVLCMTLLLPLTSGIYELPRWFAPRGSLRSYTAYRDAINQALNQTDSVAPPVNTRVLGNLNTGFALPPDRLRAYRDLGAIPPGADGALAAYLEAEEIGIVLFPREELDLIYRMRPVWNDLYGNPSRFYPQLVRTLAERGKLIATIPAPIYGMRLFRYLDSETATVEVYILKR